MSIIELLVRYSTCSSPGIGGTAARPPTLMKISIGSDPFRPHADLARRLETRMALVDGAVLQLPQRLSRVPILDFADMASFLAFTRRMSTLTPPSITTPKSEARRAMCAA